VSATPFRAIAETTPLVKRRRPAPTDTPLLRVIGGRDLLAHAVLGPGTFEIGRDEACHLTLRDSSVSRRHARLTAKDERTYVVEDLGSRNGTFVNGQPVTKGVLTVGDRLEVGSVPMRLDYTSKDDVEHLRRVGERLHARDRDPLTGLMTRAYIDEGLPGLLDESAAAGHAVSVVFVDLDRFKQVNDTFGHAVGDDVLRQIGRLIAMSVRGHESCVRYGGEEIVLVLREAALEGAVVVADRLRQVVASHDWRAIEENLLVTISCGVAEWTVGEPVREWLDRADRALYQAKRDGRNRVRRG
jgi:two-component system cell cycle response regulator